MKDKIKLEQEIEDLKFQRDFLELELIDLRGEKEYIHKKLDKIIGNKRKDKDGTYSLSWRLDQLINLKDIEP